MMKDWVLNDMSYQQRLSLGELFNRQPSETEAIMESYKIIYKKEPSLKDLAHYIKEDFEDMLEGLKIWIDSEAEYLHYEPTPEEISAGINQLKCPLSTAVSIGKDFGLMPNDVLERPYSEIFTILWSNNENAKFEKKLQKIMNRK